MTRLIRNMMQGAGSIFCIVPAGRRRTTVKKRYRPNKSISAALKSDWEKVGGDISRALGNAANAEK